MTTTINTPNLDLNQLIEGLRREDDRNMHLTNRFKWLMWIFAPLYFCFFLFGFFDFFCRATIGVIVEFSLQDREAVRNGGFRYSSPQSPAMRCVP